MHSKRPEDPSFPAPVAGGRESPPEGKSEVSGGILASCRARWASACTPRGLDAFGNSARGVRVCKELTTRLGLHVFATEDEDAVLGDAAPAPEQMSGV
ncbi:MAG TPA: glutaminase [Solirubrobacteraceae bacterium]|nr:glutaminase [Solirubrobacteraceae bacterium]